MSKFSKGDLATITRRNGEGVIVEIENWRGGSVAPYVVRVLKSTNTLYQVGQLTYLSGRDMEHKEMSMSGKKKVYCCHTTCSTYSFEDKGTLKWECFKHYPNNFNQTGNIKECEMNAHLTTEDKLNLLLEHLGLEIESEPKVVKISTTND